MWFSWVVRVLSEHTITHVHLQWTSAKFSPQAAPAAVIFPAQPCNDASFDQIITLPFLWCEMGDKRDRGHSEDNGESKGPFYWHGLIEIQAWISNHGWPSTLPGTCTQPCPIVDTAVPPLLTQPCPGRTMSTAVCIYVAGLCASCPAV